MNNTAKVVIFGKDHESKGEIYIQTLETPNAALGTSVGVTSKPNEDCLGVSILGSEIVLVIADGHWGRDASEIAVSKAVELLQNDNRPSKDSGTKAQFFALFEEVNTELYQMATSAPDAAASETTLIVCQIKETHTGNYLYWSSFGDSFLFLLRRKKLMQLNSLHSFWLGYRSKLSENADTKTTLMQLLANESGYVSVATGLETGIEKLEAGDTIFLCTDGLIGSDTEPDPSVLDALTEVLTSDVPLGTQVEKVISAALHREEKDNISCVIALI